MSDDTPEDDIFDITPSRPAPPTLVQAGKPPRRDVAPPVRPKLRAPPSPEAVAAKAARLAGEDPASAAQVAPSAMSPTSLTGEIIDIRRPLRWRGQVVAWSDTDIVEAVRRSETERARNLPAYEFYKGEWLLPGLARKRREEDARALQEGREPRLDVHVRAALEARDRANRPVGEAIAGRYDSPDQARCPICQGDRETRLAMEDELQRPDPPDLLELAVRYRFKPSEIAAHAAKCFGSVPSALASTKAVEARMSSLEAFGLELVEGVRSALAQAEAVLMKVAGEKATVDVAKGFISLAKARAQVLDGALARAERRRVLDALERAEAVPATLSMTANGGSVVALPARSQRLAEAIARRQAQRIISEPEPVVIEEESDEAEDD